MDGNKQWLQSTSKKRRMPLFRCHALRSLPFGLSIRGQRVKVSDMSQNVALFGAPDYIPTTDSPPHNPRLELPK